MHIVGVERLGKNDLAFKPRIVVNNRTRGPSTKEHRTRKHRHPKPRIPDTKTQALKLLKPRITYYLFSTHRHKTLGPKPKNPSLRNNQPRTQGLLPQILVQGS